MTIVNTEVTYGQVRESVALARESGSTFFEAIVWQIENQAWTVLGYADWDEMREAEYKGLGVVCPKADVPEIGARLRRGGLTHQQIADTLGHPETTTRREVNRQLADEDVTITNARGQERPATYTKTPAAPTEYQAAGTSGATRPEPEPETRAPAAVVDIGRSSDIAQGAPEVTPAFPPAPVETPEQRAERELEHGRQSTVTRIAECVRFLDGGADQAAIFLRDFYPHEARFLAHGMRLTRTRVDSCIAFLAAIREEVPA
ncbi:MAG: hypothetical protein QM714_02845 [Nocardioides sp.]|uniref:hypothetical protein n=1 Tax=Nocardioides sp. TaxID=35761 RepID=UPI0039E36FE2